MIMNRWTEEGADAATNEGVAPIRKGVAPTRKGVAPIRERAGVDLTNAVKKGLNKSSKRVYIFGPTFIYFA